MTLTEARKYISSSLTNLYSEGESMAIARRLLGDMFGFLAIDMAAYGDQRTVDSDRVEQAVKRLLDGEPVQYIVGFEEFMGRKFNVSPGVLIPRPETQQMVEVIIGNTPINQIVNILDIGTGSGAIAVILALEFPQARVDALDISSVAIEVAAESARLLGADVKFKQADILKMTPTDERYDIIVSNPPYVTDSERDVMRKNVLEYEPHTALFVPDSDPLLFYRAIAEYGVMTLNDGGKLYFEINERFSAHTAQLLISLGYKNIVCVDDFNNKPRIICAEK